MNLIRLYLKYFIVVALVYSILMLGLDIITNREFTLNGFVMKILIFAIGLTLIVVSFHKYQVNTTAKIYGLKDPNYEVKQLRVFYSDNSPEQVFNSLKLSSHFHKVILRKEDQLIEIKTGFSGKSWGDKIIVNYKKEQARYRYEVKSKPLFFLTVIDFGQNLENVLKIERYAQISA